MDQALLPAMLKRNSGHIVVVSSLQGKFGIYPATAGLPPCIDRAYRAWLPG